MSEEEIRTAEENVGMETEENNRENVPVELTLKEEARMDEPPPTKEQGGNKEVQMEQIDEGPSSKSEGILESEPQTTINLLIGSAFGMKVPPPEYSGVHKTLSAPDPDTEQLEAVKKKKKKKKKKKGGSGGGDSLSQEFDKEDTPPADINPTDDNSDNQFNPPHFGGDGPSHFGGDGPSHFGGDGPSHFGGEDPSHFGGDRPSRFGVDGPSRFGDDGPPRFSDEGPPRFSDDGPSRFSGDGPSRFGGDRPSHFGGDGPSRFGSDNPPHFGSTEPRRLGLLGDRPADDFDSKDDFPPRGRGRRFQGRRDREENYDEWDSPGRGGQFGDEYSPNRRGPGRGGRGASRPFPLHGKYKYPDDFDEEDFEEFDDSYGPKKEEFGPRHGPDRGNFGHGPDMGNYGQGQGSRPYGPGPNFHGQQGPPGGFGPRNFGPRGHGPGNFGPRQFGPGGPGPFPPRGPGFGPGMGHGPGYQEGIGHGPGYQEGMGHGPGYQEGVGHSPGYQEGMAHGPGYQEGMGHGPGYKEGFPPQSQGFPPLPGPNFPPSGQGHDMFSSNFEGHNIPPTQQQSFSGEVFHPPEGFNQNAALPVPGFPPPNIPPPLPGIPPPMLGRMPPEPMNPLPTPETAENLIAQGMNPDLAKILNADLKFPVKSDSDPGTPKEQKKKKKKKSSKHDKSESSLNLFDVPLPPMLIPLPDEVPPPPPPDSKRKRKKDRGLPGVIIPPLPETEPKFEGPANRPEAPPLPEEFPAPQPIEGSDTAQPPLPDDNNTLSEPTLPQHEGISSTEQSLYMPQSAENPNQLQQQQFMPPGTVSVQEDRAQPQFSQSQLSGQPSNIQMQPVYASGQQPQVGLSLPSQPVYAQQFSQQGQISEQRQHPDQVTTAQGIPYGHMAEQTQKLQQSFSSASSFISQPAIGQFTTTAAQMPMGVLPPGPLPVAAPQMVPVPQVSTMPTSTQYQQAAQQQPTVSGRRSRFDPNWIPENVQSSVAISMAPPISQVSLNQSIQPPGVASVGLVQSINQPIPMQSFPVQPPPMGVPPVVSSQYNIQQHQGIVQQTLPSSQKPELLNTSFSGLSQQGLVSQAQHTPQALPLSEIQQPVIQSSKPVPSQIEDQFQPSIQGQASETSSVPQALTQDQSAENTETVLARDEIIADNKSEERIEEAMETEEAAEENSNEDGYVFYGNKADSKEEKKDAEPAQPKEPVTASQLLEKFKQRQQTRKTDFKTELTKFPLAIPTPISAQMQKQLSKEDQAKGGQGKFTFAIRKLKQIEAEQEEEEKQVMSSLGADSEKEARPKEDIKEIGVISKTEKHATDKSEGLAKALLEELKSKKDKFSKDKDTEKNEPIKDRSKRSKSGERKRLTKSRSKERRKKSESRSRSRDRRSRSRGRKIKSKDRSKSRDKSRDKSSKTRNRRSRDRSRTADRRSRSRDRKSRSRDTSRSRNRRSRSRNKSRSRERISKVRDKRSVSPWRKDREFYKQFGRMPRPGEADSIEFESFTAFSRDRDRERYSDRNRDRILSRDRDSRDRSRDRESRDRKSKDKRSKDRDRSSDKGGKDIKKDKNRDGSKDKSRKSKHSKERVSSDKERSRSKDRDSSSESEKDRKIVKSVGKGKEVRTSRDKDASPEIIVKQEPLEDKVNTENSAQKQLDKGPPGRLEIQRKLIALAQSEAPTEKKGMTLYDDINDGVLSKTKEHEFKLSNIQLTEENRELPEESVRVKTEAMDVENTTISSNDNAPKKKTKKRDSSSEEESDDYMRPKEKKDKRGTSEEMEVDYRKEKTIDKSRSRKGNEDSRRTPKRAGDEERSKERYVEDRSKDRERYEEDRSKERYVEDRSKERERFEEEKNKERYEREKDRSSKRDRPNEDRDRKNEYSRPEKRFEGRETDNYKDKPKYSRKDESSESDENRNARSRKRVPNDSDSNSSSERYANSRRQEKLRTEYQQKRSDVYPVVERITKDVVKSKWDSSGSEIDEQEAGFMNKEPKGYPSRSSSEKLRDDRTRGKDRVVPSTSSLAKEKEKIDIDISRINKMKLLDKMMKDKNKASDNDESTDSSDESDNDSKKRHKKDKHLKKKAKKEKKKKHADSDSDEDSPLKMKKKKKTKKKKKNKDDEMSDEEEKNNAKDKRKKKGKKHESSEDENSEMEVSDGGKWDTSKDRKNKKKAEKHQRDKQERRRQDSEESDDVKTHKKDKFKKGRGEKEKYNSDSDDKYKEPPMKKSREKQKYDSDVSDSSPKHKKKEKSNKGRSNKIDRYDSDENDKARSKLMKKDKQKKSKSTERGKLDSDASEDSYTQRKKEREKRHKRAEIEKYESDESDRSTRYKREEKRKASRTTERLEPDSDSSVDSYKQKMKEKEKVKKERKKYESDDENMDSRGNKKKDKGLKARHKDKEMGEYSSEDNYRDVKVEKRKEKVEKVKSKSRNDSSDEEDPKPATRKKQKQFDSEERVKPKRKEDEDDSDNDIERRRRSRSGDEKEREKAKKVERGRDSKDKFSREKDAERRDFKERPASGRKDKYASPSVSIDKSMKRQRSLGSRSKSRSRSRSKALKTDKRKDRRYSSSSSSSESDGKKSSRHSKEKQKKTKSFSSSEDGDDRRQTSSKNVKRDVNVEDRRVKADIKKADHDPRRRSRELQEREHSRDSRERKEGKIDLDTLTNKELEERLKKYKDKILDEKGKKPGSVERAKERSDEGRERQTKEERRSRRDSSSASESSSSDSSSSGSSSDSDSDDVERRNTKSTGSKNVKPGAGSSMELVPGSQMESQRNTETQHASVGEIHSTDTKKSIGSPEDVNIHKNKKKNKKKGKKDNEDHIDNQDGENNVKKKKDKKEKKKKKKKKRKKKLKDADNADNCEQTEKDKKHRSKSKEKTQKKDKSKILEHQEIISSVIQPIDEVKRNVSEPSHILERRPSGLCLLADYENDDTDETDSGISVKKDVVQGKGHKKSKENESSQDKSPGGDVVMKEKRKSKDHDFKGSERKSKDKDGPELSKEDNTYDIKTESLDPESKKVEADERMILIGKDMNPEDMDMDSNDSIREAEVMESEKTADNGSPKSKSSSKFGRRSSLQLSPRSETGDEKSVRQRKLGKLKYKEEEMLPSIDKPDPKCSPKPEELMPPQELDVHEEPIIEDKVEQTESKKEDLDAPYDPFDMDISDDSASETATRSPTKTTLDLSKDVGAVAGSATTFSLPATSGITSLPLPHSVPIPQTGNLTTQNTSLDAMHSAAPGVVSSIPLAPVSSLVTGIAAPISTLSSVGLPIMQNAFNIPLPVQPVQAVQSVQPAPSLQLSSIGNLQPLFPSAASALASAGVTVPRPIQSVQSVQSSSTSISSFGAQALFPAAFATSLLQSSAPAVLSSSPELALSSVPPVLLQPIPSATTARFSGSEAFPSISTPHASFGITAQQSVQGVLPVGFPTAVQPVATPQGALPVGQPLEARQNTNGVALGQIPITGIQGKFSVPNIVAQSGPVLDIPLPGAVSSPKPEGSKQIKIKTIIPKEKAQNESDSPRLKSRWDTARDPAKSEEKMPEAEELYDPFAMDTYNTPPQSPKNETSTKTDSETSKLETQGKVTMKFMVGRKLMSKPAISLDENDDKPWIVAAKIPKRKSRFSDKKETDIPKPDLVTIGPTVVLEDLKIKEEPKDTDSAESQEKKNEGSFESETKDEEKSPSKKPDSDKGDASDERLTKERARSGSTERRRDSSLLLDNRKDRASSHESKTKKEKMHISMWKSERTQSPIKSRERSPSPSKKGKKSRSSERRRDGSDSSERRTKQPHSSEKRRERSHSSERSGGRSSSSEEKKIQPRWTDKRRNKSGSPERKGDMPSSSGRRKNRSHSSERRRERSHSPVGKREKSRSSRRRKESSSPETSPERRFESEHSSGRDKDRSSERKSHRKMKSPEKESKYKRDYSPERKRTATSEENSQIGSRKQPMDSEITPLRERDNKHTSERNVSPNRYMDAEESVKHIKTENVSEINTDSEALSKKGEPETKEVSQDSIPVVSRKLPETSLETTSMLRIADESKVTEEKLLGLSEIKENAFSTPVSVKEASSLDMFVDVDDEISISTPFLSKTKATLSEIKLNLSLTTPKVPGQKTDSSDQSVNNEVDQLLESPTKFKDRTSLFEKFSPEKGKQLNQEIIQTHQQGLKEKSPVKEKSPMKEKSPLNDKSPTPPTIENWERTPTGLYKFSPKRIAQKEMSPVVKLFDISPKKTTATAFSFDSSSESHKQSKDSSATEPSKAAPQEKMDIDPSENLKFLGQTDSTVKIGVQTFSIDSPSEILSPRFLSDDAADSQDSEERPAKRGRKSKSGSVPVKRLTRRQAAQANLVLPPVMSRDMPTRGKRGRKSSSEVPGESHRAISDDSGSLKSENSNDSFPDTLNKDKHAEMEVESVKQEQSEKAVVIAEKTEKRHDVHEMLEESKVEVGQTVALQQRFAQVQSSATEITQIAPIHVPVPEVKKPDAADESDRNMQVDKSKDKNVTETAVSKSIRIEDIPIPGDKTATAGSKVIDIPIPVAKVKEINIPIPTAAASETIPKPSEDIEDVKPTETSVPQSSKTDSESTAQLPEKKGFSLKLMPSVILKQKEKPSQSIGDVFETHTDVSEKKKILIKLLDPLAPLPFGPPKFPTLSKVSPPTKPSATVKPMFESSMESIKALAVNLVAEEKKPLTVQIPEAKKAYEVTNVTEAQSTTAESKTLVTSNQLVSVSPGASMVSPRATMVSPRATMVSPRATMVSPTAAVGSSRASIVSHGTALLSPGGSIVSPRSAKLGVKSVEKPVARQQITCDLIGNAIQVIGQENLRRIANLQKENSRLQQQVQVGKKIEVLGNTPTQETLKSPVPETMKIQVVGSFRAAEKAPTAVEEANTNNSAAEPNREEAELNRLEHEKILLLHMLDSQSAHSETEIDDSVRTTAPSNPSSGRRQSRDSNDMDLVDAGDTGYDNRGEGDVGKANFDKQDSRDRRDGDSYRGRRDDDYDNKRSSRRDRDKSGKRRSRERSRERDAHRGRTSRDRDPGRSRDKERSRERERERSRERRHKRRHSDFDDRDWQRSARRRSRSRSWSRDKRSRSRDRRSHSRERRSRSRERGRVRRSRSRDRRSKSRERRSRSREKHRHIRRSRSKSRDRRSRSRDRGDSKRDRKDDLEKKPKESALEKFEKELAEKKKILLQPVPASTQSQPTTQAVVTAIDHMVPVQAGSLYQPEIHGQYPPIEPVAGHFLPQPFPTFQGAPPSAAPEAGYFPVDPNSGMFPPQMMGLNYYQEGMTPGPPPPPPGHQGPHGQFGPNEPTPHGPGPHFFPGPHGPFHPGGPSGPFPPGPPHQQMEPHFMHGPPTMPMQAHGPPSMPMQAHEHGGMDFMGQSYDPNMGGPHLDLPPEHHVEHHVEHPQEQSVEQPPYQQQREQWNSGEYFPDEVVPNIKLGIGGPGIPGHPVIRPRKERPRISRFSSKEEQTPPVEGGIPKSPLEVFGQLPTKGQFTSELKLGTPQFPKFSKSIDGSSTPVPSPGQEPNVPEWSVVGESLPPGQFSAAAMKSDGGIEPVKAELPPTDEAEQSLTFEDIPGDADVPGQAWSDDVSDSDSGTGSRPMKVKSRWRRASEAEAPPPPPPPPGKEKRGKADSIKSKDEEEKEQEVKKEPKEESEEPKEEETKQEEAEDEEEIPINFELIEENTYLTERKRSKQMREVRRMVCDCTTSREDREMGYEACGEDCLNKMLFIECGSKCPCGDYCNNKRFQKKQNSQVSPFKTSWKGYGLKALQELEPGDFVMEYVGEVLDYRLFKSRSKQYSKAGQEHFYFMAINPEEIVDATYKGNISRFINHSCDPNCETQKWTVNGVLRVGFFVRKPIKENEEITFDYKYEVYGREAQKCYCGTEICRGWLGGDKRMELKSSTRRSVDEVEMAQEKKRKELFDDSDKLEEEIELMSELHQGLRNKNDVLNICRLMVRAEDPEHRMQILKVLENTTESACLRLFLDYHGLSLIWCWMADIKQAVSELKPLMLKILKKLPITNKTILVDSKILDIVTKWAEPVEMPTTFEPTLDSNETTDNTEDDSESVSMPLVTSNKTPVSILTSLRDAKPVKKRVKFADVESSSDSESRTSASESDFPSETVEGDVSSSSQTNKPPSKKKREIMELRRKVLEKDGAEEELEQETQELFQSTDIDSQTEDQSSQGDTTLTDLEGVVVDSSEVVTAEAEKPASVGISEKDQQELENLVKAAEVSSMASDLLTHWANLKEVYKIPKKEVLEERKRMEQELETNYKKTTKFEDFKKVSGWDKGRKRKREPSYKDDTDDSDSGTTRKSFLATPPKISKSERRQLFEAQVKARDEMHAEIQRQQQEQMENEQMQEQLLQQQHQRQLMQDPNFLFYAIQDPNFLPSIGIDPHQFIQQLAMDPELLQQLMATNPNFPQQLEHLTMMYQQAMLHASQPELAQGQGYPAEMTPLPQPGDDEPMTEQHLAFLQQVEAFKQQHLEPASNRATSAVEEDDIPPPPSPPKGKAVVLPPNWKTAKDAEGKMYYYHTVTRQTQWDPPNLDTGEHTDDNMDLGTPVMDDPSSKYYVPPKFAFVEPERVEYSEPAVEDDKKTTTAAADTSSETSRKLKEQFKTKMSSWIVVCLNPFRKQDCKLGKITSTEDFKHLARKLTHHVMAKELKHCRHVEDLEVNENVKSKAKDFVKKYMVKFGLTYKRSGNSPTYE